MKLYPPKCSEDLPSLAGLYTLRPFQSPEGYSRPGIMYVLTSHHRAQAHTDLSLSVTHYTNRKQIHT